ncbi:MAG: hypothetical protein KAS32_19425 [Candidatus Peribacteraceae bacterium]|nr:hypothetical protein [Candidatus Peribacteraceae bacterium]
MAKRTKAQKKKATAKKKETKKQTPVKEISKRQAQKKLETTVSKPILKKKTGPKGKTQVRNRKKKKQGWWVPTALDLLPKMPELFSSARFRLLLEQDYGVKVSKVSISSWFTYLKKRGMVKNNCHSGQTWTYVGMPEQEETVIVVKPLELSEIEELAEELEPLKLATDGEIISDLETKNLELQYEIEELKKDIMGLTHNLENKSKDLYRLQLDNKHKSDPKYVQKLESKIEVYKELLAEQMK